MEEVKLELVKKAIDEKKGEEIVTLDVSLTSPICSYIIVATMLNGRHGKAIADEITTVVEKMNQRVMHLEGSEKDPWILVDLGDIIVHLFTKEERARIGLEDLIKSTMHHEK